MAATEPCDDISVLISIYKDDDPCFFAEALSSIYSEQIKKPAEIILVADGEITAAHKKVIDEFNLTYPGVMTFLPLEKNVGLAAALNYGLAHCRHNLVARMDADDISVSERFALQHDYMSRNRDIGVCGGFVEEVEPDDLMILGIRKVPVTHQEILSFAKRRSPVSHPSVMFKKNLILSHGGYPDFRKCQDYALWSCLLTRGVKFANIPQVLLKMRAGNSLHVRRGFAHFKYELVVMKYQYQIGFISLVDFFINLSIRFTLRATPIFLRKFFYNLR